MFVVERMGGITLVDWLSSIIIQPIASRFVLRYRVMDYVNYQGRASATYGKAQEQTWLNKTGGGVLAPK